MGAIFMDMTVKGSDILVHEPDLDLDETLDCGQAFRWRKIASDYDCTYTGSFVNDKLTVSQVKKGEFIFHNTTEADFLGKWCDYFDFATDYSELKRCFSEDETLSKACAFAGGIRLLRQDSWECLISFIISQNNNIPRIKGIIDRLCDNCGGDFPTPEQLAQELGRPENEEVLMVMDLGYAAEGAGPLPNHASRKPLAETVSYL